MIPNNNEHLRRLGVPYTYLIGWSTLNKWYYGVRYSKRCNPNDLWVKYFTSSKLVKQFRNKFGEPDVVEVRKIFNNSEDAIVHKGIWTCHFKAHHQFCS